VKRILTLTQLLYKQSFFCPAHLTMGWQIQLTPKQKEDLQIEDETILKGATGLEQSSVATVNGSPQQNLLNPSVGSEGNRSEENRRALFTGSYSPPSQRRYGWLRSRLPSDLDTGNSPEATPQRRTSSRRIRPSPVPGTVYTCFDF